MVITSALHAEGREFEPRQNLAFYKNVSIADVALTKSENDHRPIVYDCLCPIDVLNNNCCDNRSKYSIFKNGKGATGVEPVTSRSAVECSATELYPQC